jgi:predicted transcriptional regulator
VDGMKKLIIKVGGDMLDDMKEAWLHPHPSMGGTLTVYLKPKQLARILSPKRFELWLELLEKSWNPVNVSELAKKTKRKQAAVSRDLAVLEMYGMIQKRKNKQNVIAKSNCGQIVIELARKK